MEFLCRQPLPRLQTSPCPCCLSHRLVSNSTEWTSGSTRLIHRQFNPLNRASPYVINPFNRTVSGLTRIDEWTRWARGPRAGEYVLPPGPRARRRWSGRVPAVNLSSPGLLDAQQSPPGARRLTVIESLGIIYISVYLSDFKQSIDIAHMLLFHVVRKRGFLETKLPKIVSFMLQEEDHILTNLTMTP